MGKTETPSPKRGTGSAEIEIDCHLAPATQLMNANDSRMWAVRRAHAPYIDPDKADYDYCPSFPIFYVS